MLLILAPTQATLAAAHLKSTQQRIAGVYHTAIRTVDHDQANLWHANLVVNAKHRLLRSVLMRYCSFLLRSRGTFLYHSLYEFLRNGQGL